MYLQFISELDFNHFNKLFREFYENYSKEMYTKINYSDMVGANMTGKRMYKYYVISFGAFSDPHTALLSDVSKVH